MRSSKDRRRSWIAGLIVLVQVASILFATIAYAPPAHAATCFVRNVRTGGYSSGFGGNLQLALEQAERHDTLRVKGRCVGNFVARVGVRIIGDSTPRFPRPVFTADHHGHVLVTYGETIVHDVIIKDGWAPCGGGILNNARITLSGQTLVYGNRATSGAGICGRGQVILTGHTVVRGNVARSGGGGGISVGYEGGLVMTGKSVVSGNRAINGGGIIGNISLIEIRQHAQVRGNLAEEWGGGIADIDGITYFYGWAAVVHNVAGDEGGGFFCYFCFPHMCSRLVRLSPNDPNDAMDYLLDPSC